jgi:quercetin dioxygenase-like cupin family protein
MNDRVGNGFAAMGRPHDNSEPPSAEGKTIPPGALAIAADNGDFQVVQQPAPAGEPTPVSNLVLPFTPGPYVLHDGGGERFGGNTFLAKNANSTGQFLFLMTEGGPGPGVPAHFHARHFENFFGMDGETLGWAYGKAVSLKAGDYFQAPPRTFTGSNLRSPTIGLRRSSRRVSLSTFSPAESSARTAWVGARKQMRASGLETDLLAVRLREEQADAAPHRARRLRYVPHAHDEQYRTGRISARCAWANQTAAAAGSRLDRGEQQRLHGSAGAAARAWSGAVRRRGTQPRDHAGTSQSPCAQTETRGFCLK